jgi:transposase
MSGYIEGVDREQSTLFPDRLEDWIGEDHPVRVVDAFVDALDLSGYDFDRTAPAKTGRPGYHPSVLLKLFIYGYLNRIASSRRLEREAGRNIEVMWLTGRLAPDHKTIADFRRDNSTAIRKTCARYSAQLLPITAPGTKASHLRKQNKEISPSAQKSDPYT